MKLADRPEEKRLVVGSLSRLGSPEALKLALSATDDYQVSDEAALAVVVIVGKMKEADENADREQLRTALQQVKSRAKSQQIRDRADKVLDSLK